MSASKLGSLQLEAVGLRYYGAGIKSGERVTLEREPDNRYDRNAIAVKKKSGKVAGHIAREWAALLAPLVDAGYIKISGVVLNYSPNAPIATLKVEISAGKNWNKLMRPIDEIVDEQDLIFEMVRRLYREPKGLKSHITENLLDRFAERFRSRLRPETRLLLKLLPQKFALRSAERLTKRLLSFLGKGEPIEADGICIIPLKGGNGRRLRYTVLEDALKEKKVKISEVDEQGSVQELMVWNRSRSRVLIMEGEELIGVKQNRIVNISILVPPMKRLVIPVSCVESGRWSYRRIPDVCLDEDEDEISPSEVGDDLRLGAVAFPRLRQRARACIDRSIAESGDFSGNQDEVWQEIDHCLSYLKVPSSTRAMHDAFKTNRDAIDGLVKRLKLPRGTRGYAAYINGEFLCCDIFDKSETLRKKWNRIAVGLALDALRARKGRTRKGVSSEDAKRLIERLSEAEMEPFAPPGDGDGIRLSAEGLSAFALICSGSVVHFSAVAIEPGREETQRFPDL